MSDLLQALNSELRGHPAFRNPLFKEAKTTPWSLEKLRIIGPQYYLCYTRLPEAMAKLSAKLPTERLRTLVVAILYSELGGEKWEEAHYLLFRRLMLTSGLTEEEIDNCEYFEETNNIVEGFEQLFATEDYPVGLGAEYALELQSLGMIGGIQHGFQGFLDRGADAESFKVHQVGEPAHIENVKLLVDDEVFAGRHKEIMYGSSQMLTMWADLWSRLYQETYHLN